MTGVQTCALPIYDAWLTKPYDDQADHEALCEQYDESDSYKEDLAEWLSDPDNEGETEEDWYDSYNYQRCVERWAENRWQ